MNMYKVLASLLILCISVVVYEATTVNDHQSAEESAIDAYKPVQPGDTSPEDCCGKSDRKKWELVMHYANYDAPSYGDNTTTHCQCRQACLNKKGCSGYDYYPYGTGTKCWIGNNCPVSLTHDVNNQHWVPKNRRNCYHGVAEVTWKMVWNLANWAAWPFGDVTTTHCQCRQACIDLPGCSGYDWYPKGTPNGTKCWIGNNCPVTLQFDNLNQHYTPSTRYTECYPGGYPDGSS